jgi:hypothetical protein
MTMDISTIFISVIIFFGEAFKYGDTAKFSGYLRINAELPYVEFRNVISL